MGDALCDRRFLNQRIELLCSTPPVQLYLKSFRLHRMLSGEGEGQGSFRSDGHGHGPDVEEGD